MVESWHRKQAIQIAAALPETREDALVVLDLARELVEKFLFGDQRPELALERERAAVVSLSSATRGASR
jgi:hypothetical protein